MNEIIVKNIIEDLNLNQNSIVNTIGLINEGATIPFISRYRKEKTGNLDELQVKDIFLKYEYYQELEERKQTVLKTIDAQGKLTPELKKQIINCKDKQALEDLYLPYKPKKRTRAAIAKEKGLEPLAEVMMNRLESKGSRSEIIKQYIDSEKGVSNEEEALAGAMDIIAEQISEEAKIRSKVRSVITEQGMLEVKPKKEWKEKKSKYENYYSFSGKLHKEPSHRILAIRRGVKEGVLSDKINLENSNPVLFIKKDYHDKCNSVFKSEVELAAEDAYKRLIAPSVEKEVLKQKIEKSEVEAIDVFAKNLENILLAPPAGQKVIMGIDPGYRTGCKVVVINQQGDYKETVNIYPHEPQKRRDEAAKLVLALIKKYNVEIIAIGNGTASKETDQLVKELIKTNKLDVISIMISEAGASVYSASQRAVDEFPELDVTVRGAISIARRLQDPLSELVKIEPCSIGVGQYQHDVNQAELKKRLDMSVESVVNRVGVDLNIASIDLLSYISGVSSSVASEIVKYRSQNGSFKNRDELLKVPKLGNKIFEQCAGFMRIANQQNVLDNSAIHPESYYIVEKMASDLQVTPDKLIGNNELIDKIDLNSYIDNKVGLLTLQDIVSELKKPGRDPRDKFVECSFSDQINEIDDLKIDMELDGIITNVTDFGAFTDIGVHQDGLIHISKLSDSFVSNPHDIVAVGDIVKVRVISIDKELKRIGLEKIAKITQN